MKISFDLDDTLIPSLKDDFPTENRGLFQRVLGIELLRSGTRELIGRLKKEGHEVGVYTTSFRSERKIYFQMATYGIRLDFVINESLNRKMMSSRGIHSSKYPPAFGIDLHIDDSKGVGMEGKLLNFKTVIIEKQDMNWSNKVLAFCNSFKQ